MFEGGDEIQKLTFREADGHEANSDHAS